MAKQDELQNDIREDSPATPQEPNLPSAQGSGMRLREKIHMAFVRVQCSLVLLQHKYRKKTAAKQRASLRRLNAWPLYTAIGELLYNFGFQGEYFLIRSGRNIRVALRWLRRFLIRGCRAAGRRLRVLGAGIFEDALLPGAVFFRGIFHVFQTAHRVRKEKGFFHAVWAALCYLGRGIRLYARLLPRVVAYVVPIAAAVACGIYVRDQMTTKYMLAVQVEGSTVGYVQNEGVFESAKSTVNERINYAGTSQTKWNIDPSYTLAPQNAADTVLDENQMADAILEASSDEISEGTALYIDGKLCKVTSESQQLKDYIASLKEPYEAQADANTTVQFNHTVELVDGIFFNDSFSPFADVQSYLSSDETKEQDYTVTAGDSISLIASKNGLTLAQLYALNPGLTQDSKLLPGDTLIVQKQEAVLEVQIIKTETYTETIPYDSNTTNSDEYAWGTTKVVQEGVDGVRSVTAQYTYDTAGNVLNTEILSKEVVQEPVTEEIVKGTKMPQGSVAKYGSGYLMWPVPGYKYCSRWYTPGGHKGVDICAAYGTPILAADSGVVVAAGFSAAGNGYGYSIVIDHGNGYKTLYGHCSALYVSAGQSVSQGQVIAAVGSTGRSTGNHCHFEILLNGSRVPPQNVFSGK